MFEKLKLGRLNVVVSRDRISGGGLEKSSLYNQGRNFLITPEILVRNKKDGEPRAFICPQWNFISARTAMNQLYYFVNNYLDN